MSAYDNWLEQPYQEMYAREEEAGQRAEALLALVQCPWCDAELEHDEADPENLCAACGRTILDEDSAEDAAERAAEARAEF